MKDLEGRLHVIDSMSVLQMLNSARVTGRLRLWNRENRADVFFDAGNITFARVTNRSSRLGEYLVSQGAITRGALEWAAAARDGDRKKLGVHLVEEGLVEEAAVREAVTAQIREVVFEIVKWRDGKFAFREGERPMNEDILNDVPLDHLMLEGVRRMDEGE
ncbi:MAG TPA: DUF4388 domain-containing protein [bacterium]|nr:DUF4388 domain-containing protein [bacterium]